MKYYSQKNPLWSGNFMGMVGDTIERWGCLLTCICNVYNTYKNANITPAMLNEKLIKNHGYMLYPEAVASFLKWEKIKELLGIDAILNLDISAYYEAEQAQWLARIKLGAGHHYVNILRKIKDNFVIYDPLTDCIKLLPANNVVGLHKLKEV